MESNVPPAKSDKEFGAPLERPRKRKTAEAAPMPSVSESSEPRTLTSDIPVEQKGQESTIVLPEASTRSFPSGESRIDIAMRNQISSSRATTVELDTLRDLMPKLRKEVHTYSINECQLIKELEKKLPSCHEHKDVRLNLVLEEIQRLRLNRRRTLAKLKESTVKIVELQSRMEITSYEAGEVFWDGRITKISDDRYQKLDVFTSAIEEKESRENFSPTPVTHFMTDNQTLSMSVNARTQGQIHTRREQGYLTELANDVSAAYEETKKMSGQGQSMISPKPAQEAFTTYSPAAASEKVEAPTFANNTLENSLITEAPAIGGQQSNDLIDFEKVVADAQKQAARRRKITKKGLLIAVVPPAAVIGILLLDWATGIVSRSLGPLFWG